MENSGIAQKIPGNRVLSAVVPTRLCGAIKSLPEKIAGVLLPCCLLIAASPALAAHTLSAAAELHTIPTGSRTIRIDSRLTIHDAYLNRPLKLRVYYPTRAGHWPVIIFSHGLGGNNQAFAKLNRVLAENGFVIIAPNHPDSGIFGRMRRNNQLHGRLVLHQSLITSGLTATRRELHGKSPVMARLRQMEEILDQLHAISHKLPGFNGRFDYHRIGMAGHSFGAVTSELMGGILRPTLLPVPWLPDRRIRAVEIISGRGSGPYTVVNSKARRAGDIPLLVITGSADNPPDGHGFAWREEPFLKSPPGNKFLLFIQGATHDSFGGDPLVCRMDSHAPNSERIQQIGEAVQRTSLEFWQYVFRRSDTAKTFLYSNVPGKSHDGINIQHK